MDNSHIEDAYPLSPLQEGLLFHSLEEQGENLHVTHLACRFTDLDVNAFTRAWQKLIERHPVLRTAFAWEGVKRPLQVVGRKVRLPLVVEDWRGLPPDEQVARINARIEEEQRRGFSPSRAPLIRLALFRLDEGVWQFFYSHHHLILDGWSLGLLLRELFTFYDAFAAGQDLELGVRPLFRDYIAWLERQDTAVAEQVWRRTFAGFPGPTALGIDRGVGRAVPRGEGVRFELRVPTETAVRLRDLAARQRITLNSLMQGIWALLLQRYAGGTEVTFGTVVAGRPADLPGVEETLGMFVNTLPVRVALHDDAWLLPWLRERQKSLAEMRQYEHTPLRAIQRWCGLPAGQPPFDTLFLFESYPTEKVLEQRRERLGVEGVRSQIQTPYSLTLLVYPGPPLIIRLKLDSNRFAQEAGRRLLRNLGTLLEGVAADPGRRLADFPVLAAAERHQLTLEWNGSGRSTPGQPVHLRIAAQAALVPNAPAVISARKAVTHAELQQRARGLAAQLRRLGVQAEERVALCLEPSVDLAVAVLGVLWSGGAFVPLDPADPAERKAWILQDSRPRVIITRRNMVESAESGSWNLLFLDAKQEAVAVEETAAAEVDPLGAAYVIYTSGSTGRPKGVVVSHGALSGYLEWIGERLARAGVRSLPLLTRLTFDAALKQLFVPLLRGGTVRVPPQDFLVRPAGLLEELGQEPGAGLNCVPAVWQALLEAMERGEVPVPALNCLLLGGESLREDLVARTRAVLPDLLLLNLYGPTEATANATCGIVGLSGPPPLGRPVAEARLYLLDALLRPVPWGAVGEIWIGGGGVARGYLGNPGLTAERFLPDPFFGEPGARLYRTGDLARHLESGELEFRGRVDQQLKLHGLRIEPGEIEEVLAEHPDVRESAVAPVPGAGEEVRLVAYVVPARQEVPPAVEKLREHLRRRLPEGMLPSIFVILPLLPRLPSGKVDRRGLPIPAPASKASADLPGTLRTVVEEVVEALWADLLGIERVGAGDDFFDLGGHSLLAARLSARVRESLGVELPVRTVFEAPTVATLARRIENLRQEHRAELPPLVPVSRDQTLRLSFAQERLWFLDQLQPGTSLYNMPAVVRLRGRLNVGALEAALRGIEQRHEVLRTTFDSSGGRPYQVIKPRSALRLSVVDLGSLAALRRDAEAQRLARREANRSFDLHCGPLLRTTLLRISVGEHRLLATLHHIVGDAWSTGILIREVAALYPAFLAGAASPLHPLEIQYADFAAWQRTWMSDGVLAAELAWWRERLVGAPPLLAFPLDRSRPAVLGTAGGVVLFSVPADRMQSLVRLGRRMGATVFMTLLAAFEALLGRYTGEDDLLVGTPVAGRTRVEEEKLIGFFINTLVLRAGLAGTPSYRQLLHRVREGILDALAHQSLPFEKLVEELRPGRSLSHTPLFQVMFALQNAPVETLALPGLELEPILSETTVAKFDLTLSMSEGRDGLAGVLEYATDLFDRTTITRLAGQLCRLLEATAMAPDLPLETLSLLSDEEQRQILEEWSGAGAADPSGFCLAEQIAHRAATRPDAPALVSGGGVLFSYGELWQRAVKLARYLLAFGIGSETRVGLCMPRSPEAVVGLLGILTAGGAYVPLDPSQPRERLARLCTEAGLSLVLVVSATGELFAGLPVRRVEIDGEIEEDPGEEPAPSPPAGAAAYVIYTSGSTGSPKGVVVSHGALSNYVPAVVRCYGLGSNDRVLQFSSLAFDVAAEEIFPTLVSGATLVLLPPEAPATLQAFVRFLDEREVTVANLPASYWHQWVAEMTGAELPRCLRLVVIGSEAVLPARLQTWMEKAGDRVELRNAYGLTETTVTSLVWAPTPEARSTRLATVPVGRPLDNSRVYVVDRELQLVPPGLPGELVVGGSGLARGYLGQPALTAERFLPDPWSAEPGARIYRTGDRARRRESGSIEALGRTDFQVKVRGVRVEPGEVETTLAAHPAVREAAVVARELGGSPALVAYVTPAAGADPTAGELRHYLRERLPEALVPARFTVLPELPRTVGGKVNRRALPEPAGEEAADTAPRTQIEEMLAGLWAEVLGVERIGIHESFFDLGGHSLSATQLASRVRDAFGVELPLQLLFQAPTVAGLADAVGRALQGQETSAPPPIRPRFGSEDRPPLSFAQERLWFLHRLEPGRPAHNLSFAVSLSGDLAPGALSAALGEVDRRQDSLRTTFRTGEDGTLWQAMAPPTRHGHALPVADLSGLPERELAAEVEIRRAAEGVVLFDLERGPLFRTLLLRLAATTHVLLVSLHHIVADGWSMNVLVRDLTTAYGALCRGAAPSLPPLPVQYADFAVWQRRWLAGDVRERLLTFWRRRLAGAPPALELPADHPRRALRSGRGGGVSRRLSVPLARGLEELGRSRGATLFMTLLAAFAALLGRLAAQNDLVVGVPIANRNRRETEDLIGFFLNNLPLRTDLGEDPPFTVLLRRVRDTAVEAYAHQDLPFELLLEDLQPERSLSHTPVFQVAFNFLQFAVEQRFEIPGLTLASLPPLRQEANFDLTLYVEPAGGELHLLLAYSTDLFRTNTAVRLLGHLESLLEEIAARPDRRLSTLPILSAAEQLALRGSSRCPLAALSASFESFPASDVDGSLPRRFASQVERRRQNLAVRTRQHEWTYGELDRRANQVANAVLECRGSGEERVAVLLAAGAPMLAGLVGLLKAGKTYVPMDRSYPRERLGFMLEDSGASALLTNRDGAVLARELAGDDLPVLLLEEMENWLQSDPKLAVDPARPAYILYTSGSTGRPKGVVQSHRNVLHHCRAYTNNLQIAPEDRLSLLASYSFDAAVMDIFGSLLNGASLFPFDLRAEGPERLAAWLGEQGITVYHSTPTVYRHLAAALDGRPGPASLRAVVLGGEEVVRRDLELFRRSFPPGCLFVNGLGPTESTVTLQYFADHATRLARAAVPIGHPVAETEVLLLNAAGEEVDLYAAGEIVIRSPFVALGYWRRPELTAAAFGPGPEGSGTRIYRTGDLGRRLLGGEVEFIGRRDLQVKIRGYRVEIGEVEAALAAHPAVGEAVVVAGRGPDGAARLVGYLVPRPDVAAPSPVELRRFLAVRLPDYMVPVAFACLAALPLTPTQKVDRNALPEPAPEAANAEGAAVSPRTPVEEVLAGIWAEVLHRESVSLDVGFFELGGHSLLVTQVVSRVRSALGVDLPLRDLFEAPTVVALAVRVEQALRRDRAAPVPPLEPVPRSGALPLSFAQERLWFLHQMAPLSPVYNMPAVVRLDGPLSVPALAASLGEVVRRHEALRTTFVAPGGQPVQVISPWRPVPLPVVDLAGLAETVLEAEARKLADDEAGRPFDLASGPLLRCVLTALGPEHHRLVLTLHHIVSDGWSTGILVREAGALYSALVRGLPSALPGLPVQYADFAAWQRLWLAGAALEEELEYWRRQLAGLPPVLGLPFDRPERLADSDRGGRLRVLLEEEVGRGLAALSRRYGVTLFMVLLAGFQVLLGRCSDQEDVVVGSPIANRTRIEIEGLIGFFANLLVLRGDLRGDPSFPEFLAHVRETALGAYSHQDLPFERLVEELDPQRDLSRNPLFQVVLVLQNAPVQPLELTDLRLTPVPVESKTTKFDLLLALAETADGEGGLVGGLQYDADRFDSTTVARLSAHFQTLLTGLAANPERRLSSLPLLTPAERHQVVVEWSAAGEAASEECLHVRFEAQATLRPEAVAVTCGGSSLTYCELNARANQLARRLRHLGVGPEVPVGLCLERSLELVVGLLGILKAGGAYVPLDPAYPRQRLSYVLFDALGELGSPVLITQASLADRFVDSFPAGRLRILLLDGDVASIAAESGENLHQGAAVDNLAYIIYTSGSTGRPKGSLISHANVARLFTVCQAWYAFGAGDVWTLFHSAAFDFSVWELWGALLHGGRLVVVHYWVSRSPEAFHDLLVRERVTVLNQTPSAFRQLVQTATEAPQSLALRWVIFGGEALEIATLAPWFERHGDKTPRLVNMYGITETTVHVSFRLLAREDLAEPHHSPVGRALPDLRLYVLDRAGEPVPLGVAGELYVGGGGLARGYLKRPDLTAERFVPAPFLFGCAPGGRLYRTGDLVRYSPDGGGLDFLGRIDQQIKIRGFRVELGEIESVLLQYGAVREAVVVARDDGPGDRRIVAYVVADPEALLASETPEAAGATGEPVKQWRNVFDETYRRQAGDDPTFNISGWNSAYGGGPIPPEEMREWVERTVERIGALAPRRVLEIGCGTGLLLFRLAPGCERYVATDFSRTALDYVAGHLEGAGAAHVELLEREADDLSFLAPGSFDLVILNSIVQYFPSVDYLLRVLEGAVERVAPEGAVFVGDVRSLPLLKALHAHVQLALSPTLLGQRAEQGVAQEHELVLSPHLFAALPRHLKRLSRTEVRLKRGRFLNELTRFRYDVVLRVGEKAPPAAPQHRLAWPAAGLSPDLLRRHLQEAAPARLLVTDMPDARTLPAVRLLELLRSGEEADHRELTAAFDRAGGVDPEAIWELARELGYGVELAPARQVGAFDALFERLDALAGAPVLLPVDEPEAPLPWEAYATRPIAARLSLQGMPRLRAYLGERLPDHMVPAAFVFLEALPLTHHGKLDRRALPAPQQRVLREASSAPRTPVEEMVAGIWCDVLNVDRVGVEDSFFDLGGHSLLATQVASRLRSALQIEMPLRVLFETADLGSFAGEVERALRSGGEQAEAPVLRRAPRDRDLPLSFAQERLWFLDQLDPGQAVYNVPVALWVLGRLDETALRRALDGLVRRHESLRTTFEARPDGPVQVVAHPLPVTLPVVDLTALRKEEREEELRRLAHKEARLPFDLQAGPLFRIALIRLAAEERAILFTMHHIISDAWSESILVRELGAGYEEALSGEPSPLPVLPLQYPDFACWQRDWLQGAVLAAQVEHWRRRLAGASVGTTLPPDYPRPTTRSFRGARSTLRLGAPTVAALKSLARREGATLYMALLGLFATLICRRAGQDDIVVGSPIANRNRQEVEGLIGFFVNTLLLRVEPEAEPGFRSLLRQVRETCLEAYAHQDLPFEKIVEALQPVRDLSLQPLFQVMLVFQTTALPVLDIAGLVFRPIALRQETAKLDLVLSLIQDGDALALGLDYSRDLYDGTTARRFLAHLEILCQAAAAAPDSALAGLPALTPAEQHQLQVEWNDTARDYRQEGLLHRLVEEWAVRSPDAPAVRGAGRRLNYGDLIRRAGRLAVRLRRAGAGPDTPVAIFLERSPEQVVAALAALKAGGAFVPIDPAHPVERLARILGGGKIPVAVAAGPPPAALAGTGPVWVDIEEGAGLGGVTPVATPALIPLPEPDPANLAYVIYTSGSTGEPKGVMITHQGICNTLCWRRERFGVVASDRILQTVPLTFDPSIWQIFGALVSGAEVVLAAPGAGRDLASLAGHLREDGITITDFPPSLLSALLEEESLEGNALRHLFTGGEALPPRVVASFQARLGASLHNAYGPTESAIDATLWTVPADGDEARISIGRPLANRAVYVLDRHREPVPVGVSGELFLSGVGLARGYLGRPDLTALAFVPAPFGTGMRLYRTGDLVRCLPDGQLEFLGRADQQVKVRGVRVELGEIEAALASHPAVEECAVLHREIGRGGEKALVAYFAPSRGGTVPTAAEWTVYLRDRLPEAMIPVRYVPLVVMPRTVGGKVDRGGLPLPEAAEEAPYESPSGPVEELLAALWSQLLRVERVGALDSFFELGGHSLLATQLVSRVRAALDVDLPLRTVFEAPTLAALARQVEARRLEGRAPTAPPLERVSRTGRLPLSFGQQRLWFLDQLSPGLPTYNVPIALLFHGALSPAALAYTLEELVQRHEVLRTVFWQVDGEPFQRILPAGPVPLPLVDLQTLPPGRGEEEARRLASREALRPFDLTRGPLLRALLVELSAAEHLLALTLHHIVSDGWSGAILLRETAALYGAVVAGERTVLAELPWQYADFAAWQRRWLSGETLAAEIDYWRQKLADVPPVLNLPTDGPRAGAGRRAESEELALPGPLSGRLRSLARSRTATPFMILLAAFKVLLYRLSGQADLVVGSPVAGRDRAEVEGLIGFFLNTLALRTDLSGEPSFTALVDRVRATVLDAFTHQWVPFEALLPALQPERELRRAPLFQVLFNMLTLPSAEAPTSALRLEHLSVPEGGPKLDLTLYAREAGEAIELRLVYDADLFSRARMRELLGQLAVLLEQVAERPEAPIGALSLVTPAARAVLPDLTLALEEPALVSLPEQLVACAHRYADRPAVVQGCRIYSYRELIGRARGVAADLAGRGLERRAVVAVTGPRSPELIAAITGVVLSGRVLLTLDPRLAPQRRDVMLREAGAAWLIDVEAGELPFREFDGRDLPATGPDDPAYLFFTSGTSGVPKAVLGRHKGLAHFLTWERETFQVGPEDRSAQLTGLSFDVVLRDLFLPLTSGAALCLPEDADLGADRILAWFQTQRITLLHTVPSLAAFWLEGAPPGVRLDALRWVFFAGEPLLGPLVHRWRAAFSCRAGIVNLYGPTETTLAKCFYLVPDPAPEGVQPIGSPLPQTQAVVLSIGGQPCGIGEPGEIAIRTPFRSLGYSNNPEETIRRFRPSLFRSDSADLLYFTGDRGRYRPDGTLDILGRLDDQIKIRGMRVEPAEVQAALAGHPLVGECAVVARVVRPGEKDLVAYWVARSGAMLLAGGLRRHLEERLPFFMIPAVFVRLVALPLTANGKVDHGALPPAPIVPDRESGSWTAPRDPLERELAAVWEDLLGVAPVGARDDFFGLGGHSLTAVRLRSRLEERFGRSLPLAEIFRRPVLEDLAALLRADASAVSSSPLVSLRAGGGLPPFFCVHEAGGSIAPYRALAEHLSPDRPFFAFQARGLEPDEDPITGVEDLARSYLNALREVQPQGPYHLGGWSFGGRVAFEMARRLAATGEGVASLVLLDSAAPTYEEGDLHDLNEEGKSVDEGLPEVLAFLAVEAGLGVNADELRPLTASEQVERIARRAVEAGLLPAATAASHLHRRVAVFRANVASARRYRPAPYPGRITFVAAEGRTDGEPVPDRGWSRFTLQPVAVRGVPGNHHTMMRPPHVQAVATALDRVLAEADAESSTAGLVD